MKTFELTGEVRENFGKKASIKYRNEGLVPCIIYGGAEGENINFTVKETTINKLIYTPEVYLIDLTLGEDKKRAMLKEIQFHPVKDTVLHVDFLYVYDDVPVVIDVPVKLEGLAEGVKAGGRLSLDQRYLKVRALADKLPENVVIDVTGLAMNGSIQVGELGFDDFELLTPKDVVVCRVRLTRAARAAAAGLSLEELDALEDGVDLDEEAETDGADEATTDEDQASEE